MKKILTVVAFGFVVGSAGALETGNIGTVQAILQASAGIVLLFAMYRKEFKK